MGSSLAGKQQGATFLAALPTWWTTPSPPPARAACQAAVVAAGAATEAAEEAAVAAATDHSCTCRALGRRLRGGVVAVARGVVSMTSAVRRELRAKLGGFMGDE